MGGDGGDGGGGNTGSASTTAQIDDIALKIAEIQADFGASMLTSEGVIKAMLARIATYDLKRVARKLSVTSGRNWPGLAVHRHAR